MLLYLVCGATEPFLVKALAALCSELHRTLHQQRLMANTGRVEYCGFALLTLCSLRTSSATSSQPRGMWLALVVRSRVDLATILFNVSFGLV